MARKRSPVRLVIALSVAAVLAVFVLYTSLFGGSTPSLKPSQLAGHSGEVSLVGNVVGRVSGDAHGAGLRFRVADIGASSSQIVARSRPAAVDVVYKGTVPDLFRSGRHIVVNGRLRNGVFVADPGSLVTKCPSKYAPAKKTG